MVCSKVALEIGGTVFLNAGCPANSVRVWLLRSTVLYEIIISCIVYN